VTSTRAKVALGIHDDKRMAADYALVKDYVGLDKPFDVKTVVHQRVPGPLDQDDEIALVIPAEAGTQSVPEQRPPAGGLCFGMPLGPRRSLP
jgi:hypothetical protein